MIICKQGDLLQSDTEALVNTVNCVGVMGRGVALQFKKAFPENYKYYENACQQGQMRIGQVLVFKMQHKNPPQYIINFPTKRHWRNKSRIEDLKKGLISLKFEIIRYKIKSIAIPPLGCGLGGLEWTNVKPLILDTLSGLDDVEIILYEPYNKDIKIPVSVEKICS